MDARFPAAIPWSVARLREALGPEAAALRLWPSLARLDWVAALPNAAAPGYVYLAGAIDGIAVGGGGADPAEAAARLAGEAAEVIARQVDGDAPPFGLGLAAGSDPEAARLAGLLELIERDAVAAWWLDGVRPRRLEARILDPAEARVARLRAGAPVVRRSDFLALISPTGIPVVCAFSRDPGGRGLAFGFKAALAEAAAADGAIVEMLQMEIALELARHRLAAQMPTRDDLRVLRRADLDPDGFASFAPTAPAPPHPRLATLDDLVAHLASCALQVSLTNLAGPPGGLAVAKATASGLRPYPGDECARHDAPGAVAPLM